MEHPEQRPPDPLENDSTPTVSTSEVTSSRDPQISVDERTGTVGDQDAKNASYQDTETPADRVTQADADSCTQLGATAPQENLPEGKGTWLYFFFSSQVKDILGEQTAKSLFELRLALGETSRVTCVPVWKMYKGDSLEEKRAANYVRVVWARILVL